MELSLIWFILVMVLLCGYAILDGFDLGVGALHLFSKGDHNRRVMLNSIGPVWDGNEVWLLAGGGSIFAAFPKVYACLFSGFYLALILVLLGLMFRAMSLEFRSKEEHVLWRKFWDAGFGIGSILVSILFGVALGNILQGLSLNAQGDYIGSFIALLNPYAILWGIFSLTLFVAHGSLYLTFKVEEQLHHQVQNWSKKFTMALTIVYIAIVAYSFIALKHRLDKPIILGGLMVASILLLLGSVVCSKQQKYLVAFLSTSLFIAIQAIMIGFILYPNIVLATNNAAYSLTVKNSCSSQLTLKTMLIIALIGVPIVIGYTIFAYRLFRGKVELHEHSY